MENYITFNRQDWRNLQTDFSFELTNSQLQKLVSLNDRVSMDDVEAIYLPMLRLFGFYLRHHEIKQEKIQSYLHLPARKVPFIIGISGSVSVGKSTTARLLQCLLQQIYKDKTVDLMTTDGFLFPNELLQERGIMDRKGFPESYDMKRLTDFLLAVKTSTQPVSAPMYSHDIYNIIPNTYQTVDSPDILIVEGINVLQLPPNHDIYVSDFFDWSIYVDASPENIEQWYIERFELLMDLAKDNPNNYYYPYAVGDRQEAIAMAKQVWRHTNLKNLKEYILPTKSRADLILHKTENHLIDYVLLRKY